jgi:hypothetical protein
MPLLFAGGVCCAVVGSLVFGAVRALVVFPELPVAGGAEGAAAAGEGSPLVLAALELLAFVSGVRALVVLPELAAAGGVFFSVALPAAVVSAESAALALLDFRLLVDLVSAAVVSPAAVFESVPAEAESVAAVLDFDLRLLAVLPSAAAGASPVGGVALAEGSAAALFLVLLFFSGAVLAVVSPAVLSVLAVSPAAFFDLLVFFLLADVVPDAVVEASVLLSSAAAFFLVVFFEVVDLLSDVAVETVESAAGFFFFFLVVVVESLWV